jgi:hypothetical protein
LDLFSRQKIFCSFPFYERLVRLGDSEKWLGDSCLN